MPKLCDADLREYCTLKEKAAAVSKKLGELRDRILERGPFATANFVAEVDTAATMRAVGTEEIMKITGLSAEDLVTMGIFKHGEQTTVKVRPKFH